MPTFHPEQPGVPYDRNGEREVLAALRRLGDGIHVFYSLTILDGQENREREIDFLVLHPDLGLLILEVKGGRISWDEDTWYKELGSIRTPLREKPSLQMANQQFRLQAYLRAQGLQVPEITRILVLPHMDFPADTRFGPDLPPERVLDRTKLQKLIPSLQAAVSGGLDWPTFRSSPAAQAHQLFRRSLEELVEAILPSVLPPPSLAEQMAAEGRLQDEASQAVLDHLAMNFARGRFRVEGGPGSGKSLIARMVTRIWAGEGRRVLVLCYNRALKVASVIALDDLKDTEATIATFHELLDVLLDELGRPCKPPQGQKTEHFNHTLPAAFRAALPDLTQRWDALVVDEAQDLSPEWLELILPLLRHPDTDPVLLLGDSCQDLYHRGTHTLGTPWRLDLNLRQHPSLRQAVWNAMPTCGWAHPGGGLEPGIVESRKSSPETWKRQLADLLTEFAIQGLQPRDVLVLMPHSPASYGLRQDQRLGPWRIGIDKDWWEDEDQERLKVNTVHSFKGMEGNVVVYLAPAGKPANGPLLRYVALSRARHRAVILEKAIAEPEKPAVPKEPPTPPPPPFDPRKATEAQRGNILGVMKAAQTWNRTVPRT